MDRLSNKSGSSEISECRTRKIFQELPTDSEIILCECGNMLKLTFAKKNCNICRVTIRGLEFQKSLIVLYFVNRLFVIYTHSGIPFPTDSVHLSRCTIVRSNFLARVVYGDVLFRKNSISNEYAAIIFIMGEKTRHV